MFNGDKLCQSRALLNNGSFRSHHIYKRHDQQTCYILVLILPKKYFQGDERFQSYKFFIQCEFYDKPSHSKKTHMHTFCSFPIQFKGITAQKILFSMPPVHIQYLDLITRYRLQTLVFSPDINLQELIKHNKVLQTISTESSFECIQHKHG